MLSSSFDDALPQPALVFQKGSLCLEDSSSLVKASDDRDRAQATAKKLTKTIAREEHLDAWARAQVCSQVKTLVARVVVLAAQRLRGRPWAACEGSRSQRELGYPWRQRTCQWDCSQYENGSGNWCCHWSFHRRRLNNPSLMLVQVQHCPQLQVE